MAFEPEHRCIAFADRFTVTENDFKCFRPHRHDQLELIFVVQGRYLFTAEGRTEEFAPGEIFIANSGEEHTGFSRLQGEEGVYYYIQLSIKKTPRGLSEELDSLLEKLEQKELLLPYRITAERAASTGLFERGMELAECFTAKGGYNEFKLLCRSLSLYQTILEYRIYTDAEHRQQEPDPFVQQLTDYIDRHYAEELRLETVAKAFGYEPHYFCALFKKRFNKNFVKYLNAVRMQRFLSHPNLNMQTIAQCAVDVGFSNYSYFYRVFCHAYGTSPGKYLPRHRN
ncbi:MAG: helix-turn-helix domain-containing protein [Clostridia bacterium]|nr:helix-turn-helix domain-containing protein [Clostridia bacterium]